MSWRRTRFAEGVVGEVGIVLEALTGEGAAPREEARAGYYGAVVEVSKESLGPSGSTISDGVCLIDHNAVGSQTVEKVSRATA
jgi:hypothetical protein